MLAQTPEPPYTAVIFSNQRRTDDGQDYAAMAIRMEELAREQPGFLGVESVRDETGFGITISYWDTEAAATLWKRNTEHLGAQQLGRSQFYASYSLRVGTVLREVRFESDETS